MEIEAYSHPGGNLIFWTYSDFRLCVFCLIELLSNKQTNPLLDKYSQSSVYGDEMYCESNPTHIEPT